LKFKNGNLKKMSSVLDGAIFPGNQGGPLEHVIAAKGVAFGEALNPLFKDYAKQIQLNSKRMSTDLVDLGFGIVSGGTDNHLLLIDLRNKNITGRDAENSLGKAGITVNKNMVPYDDQSPFVTSGIRIGTPAITTRGLKEEDMGFVAESINEVINNYEDDQKLNSISDNVKSEMKDRPLFA